MPALGNLRQEFHNQYKLYISVLYIVGLRQT